FLAIGVSAPGITSQRALSIGVLARRSDDRTAADVRFISRYLAMPFWPWRSVLASRRRLEVNGDGLAEPASRNTDASALAAVRGLVPVASSIVLPSDALTRNGM